MGRYGAVGVVNFAVDFCVFMALVKIVGLPIAPANVLSWLVVLSVSYTLNLVFIFPGSGPASTRTAMLFVLVSFAAMTANTTGLLVAAIFLPIWAAKLVSAAVSFAVGFPLSRATFTLRDTITS